ncbi:MULTISPECIES: tripartite tricarboxylate transporter TctB family protein [Micrococcaceae]|uniref:tripartite tricarboxylate transporter TctB family protein n=1 Tax=Micrococcaceae TaxID=1268 RepID=UPI001621EECE|nr:MULTISPECIES: tripartite tricarboxylate transporter TctB family protein [Micrococcaceae]HRO31638.1 tripartite tricarboxylate transporter TctB family protein [Citricoccus sp.]HRO95198.1 tripartite tricarboxylate transporter TctB family protein [Citricoccus sp.]
MQIKPSSLSDETYAPRTGGGTAEGAASASGTPEGTPQGPTPARTPGARPRRSFWSGRSELIMPVLVAGLATWLAYETATMTVLGTSVPGPQFFPTIVCVLLYAVAVVHAVQVLRTPRLPDPTDDAENADVSSDLLGDLAHASEKGRRRIAGQNPDAKLPKDWKTYTDWKTVGLVVGGIALFILVLPVLGWVFSAAGLFWIVCKALGSTRPGFDVVVSLVFAAVIQLAFNAGLGLNLPSGFLEGLL